MFTVMPEDITNFLREMMPERSELLKSIEKECLEEYIPLVEPEVGRFLQVLVQIKRPSRILEIGTGIGYSSILLAQALDENKHITTIEIDKNRYERACKNFAAAGINEIITPLWGDANEIIPTLKGPFDFVFMDAAKGQYPEFFSKIWPLLCKDGVLVIDNIFLNGWVINMTWPERRKKTMVCRVRKLLETLKNHTELTTAIVPLGDGLSVSTRRALHEKS